MVAVFQNIIEEVLLLRAVYRHYEITDAAVGASVSVFKIVNSVA